jgi:pilus assembly protein Flp/PilA
MHVGLFTAFWAEESGATAIEYGLIAALISVAIVGSTTFLSSGISNTFNYVATHVTAAGAN